MPTIRLKIRPSHEGLTALSTDRPDDEFRILDAHPSEEGLFVLYDVETTAPTAVVESFRETSDVDVHDVLRVSNRRLLLRCSMVEPLPYRAARDSENLATSPLVLRDGWLYVESTTSSHGISRLKDEFEAAGVRYEVCSITQSYDTTSLLTERQDEFLHEAVERGYYDTPRRCSLTDVGEALGVTKGTASRLLHRAEGAVVKAFVSESA